MSGTGKPATTGRQVTACQKKGKHIHGAIIARCGTRAHARRQLENAAGDLLMTPEQMLDLARRAAELVVERTGGLSEEKAWDGDFQHVRLGHTKFVSHAAVEISRPMGGRCV